MAFTSSSSHALPLGKRAPVALSAGPAPSTSILVEKAKSSMRQSTPDSEALASSDDEQDMQTRAASIALQHGQKTVRSPSWKSDPQSAPRQKPSHSKSEPYSSNSQQPNLASDGTSWPQAMSNVARVAPNNTALPWGNAIWNYESQKAPPSRLTEVLPSPTNAGSMNPQDEALGTPPPRRDSFSEGSIPFAIPLHPTLKAYRSQSYSVGQLDQETISTTPPRHAQPGFPGRHRVGSSYTGLQHRPSRPSVLGDFSPDTSVLEQLREVDDDDEGSTVSSEAGLRLSNSQARTIEQLAMENALLRQQALVYQSSQVASPSAIGGGQPNLASRFAFKNYQSSESALDEREDLQNRAGDLVLSRGFEPVGLASTAESYKVDFAKKGHWQSSLGFGGISEVPQSRRHSFAEVPLRHSLVSQAADSKSNSSNDVLTPNHDEPRSHATKSDNMSYFSNPFSRTSESYRPPSSSSSQADHAIIQQTRTPHFPHAQAHQGQPLYLVTFKAARAEFYYIQEGTGLEVNAGDLVIVEADRGTDLGTVAHKNVAWTSARELKERYVAEHYNWLMMFSRQGKTSHGSGHPNGSDGSTRSGYGNTVGMGSTSSFGATDGPSVEIKTKMIKRLAQSHEIHSLREKEGNEAKAKRMCQQKVAEHHLNMEILDAEFQMDWKKLTFYYFADAYVNFNSLVTDLFKIYKTRIWMSAINPASFISPGPHLPAAHGFAMGSNPADRDRFGDHHYKFDGHVYNQAYHPGLPQGKQEVSWNPSLGAPAHAPTTISHYNPYIQNITSSQGFITNNLDPSRPIGLSGRTSSPPQMRSFRLSENQDLRHPESIYKEEAANPSFEQLSVLQGLSLGS